MKNRPFVPKPKKVKEPVSPCVGCEYERAGCKIVPLLLSSPALVVIGDAPDEAAEFIEKPFAGDVKDMIDAALTDSGWDLEAVQYMNLSRCRAYNDDLGHAIHQRGEKRCLRYLKPDLAQSTAPILLLGDRALGAFWRSEKGRKPKVGAYRGLWIEDKNGRKCFVARHPRDILADRNPEARRAEFFADIARMSSSMQEAPLGTIKSQVYANPLDAREFLARLAAHPGPWAFDIEAYDAKEFPSRRDVATDPCHPDFRLRGIGFSWAVNEGAYVDLIDYNEGDGLVIASELFTPVFASEAEKETFSGHYDEEGVTYTKLAADGVCNRAGDGMLAMIALGDGTHDSLRLEKAVVDVLGRPQYWVGYDKSKMRDASLAEVADGAIGDACYTFELCDLLHDRISRADYLKWSV